MQLLRLNSFTMQVAQNNPMSLRDAIVQAAVLGVTLNPAVGHGYLVPRDGKVLFQPSYRGIRDIAIEEGLIRWARAEVVHAKDAFELEEREDGSRVAIHRFQPLGDRGVIVGAFCAWETSDGRRDVVFETIDEVYASHRARSDAWKKQSGIWKTDENEAIRKALLKRAQKSWPRRTDRANGRFEAAVAAELAADDSIETTATEVREAPASARIARPSATPHQGKASSVVAPEPEPEPADTSVDVSLGIEIEDLLDQLSGGDDKVRRQYETEAKRLAGLPASGELDPAQLTALRDELAKAAAEAAE